MSFRDFLKGFTARKSSMLKAASFSAALWRCLKQKFVDNAVFFGNGL